MSAADIIASLGGRGLPELIDPAFLREHGLSPPAQYGMVCGDVAGEIRRLEALGATPFVHATMEAPGWTEQGRRKKVRVEMAMGYTVNIGVISTHFAYFDTREPLGLWLEIAQYRVLGRHRPPTEAFITRLARMQRRLE